MKGAVTKGGASQFFSAKSNDTAALAVGFINCIASIDGFVGSKITGDLSERTGRSAGLHLYDRLLESVKETEMGTRLEVPVARVIAKGKVGTMTLTAKILHSTSRKPAPI